MSGGGSTTTTTQELSPEQQELLGYAMPAVKDIVENPPELYQGSSVAGFTDLQKTAQDTAVSTATGSVAPLVDSTIGAHQDLQASAIPSGTSGLQQIAGGADAAAGLADFFGSGGAMDAANNPYLAQYAEGAVGALSDDLLQKVLPGIRRGAQTSGQVGSSRQGIAEGLAIQDFNQQAGNITSSIYSDAYGQGLDATNKAFSDLLGTATDASQSLLGEGTRSLFATPDIASLALLPSQILDAVGTQQQTMNQNVLTDEINKYMTEQMLPFMLSQDIANMAFSAPGGTTTSTTSGGGGGLSTFLGIGSALAGLPIF